jgi:YD repeat-containing protein
MYARFKIVGIGLVIAGLAFVGVGGYTYMKTQQGANALNAFSAAEAVKLSYNEQGQLTDHGDAAGGQTILNLLKNDWGYAVDPAELNPNDPVVNTASEYMVQMATIAHHTLDSTVKVTLTEDATKADGTVVPAGTYDVPVNGRYFSQFDRTDPLDGKARDQAWSPLAHALIAELGVGSVTASTLQVGLGIAALAAALGGVLLLTGLGIVWAARPVEETVTEKATKRAAVPAAI